MGSVGGFQNCRLCLPSTALLTAASIPASKVLEDIARDAPPTSYPLIF
jgi:hypothetical protein